MIIDLLLPIAALAIMIIAALLTLSDASASTEKQNNLSKQLDAFLTRVERDEG